MSGTTSPSGRFKRIAILRARRRIGDEFEPAVVDGVHRHRAAIAEFERERACSPAPTAGNASRRPPAIARRNRNRTRLNSRRRLLDGEVGGEQQRRRARRSLMRSPSMLRSSASGSALSITDLPCVSRVCGSTNSMSSASGVEQQQQRFDVVAVTRRAAQRERAIGFVVPAFLRAIGWPWTVEPGDLVETRRDLAIAFEKIARTQYRIAVCARASASARSSPARGFRPCRAGSSRAR